MLKTLHLLLVSVITVSVLGLPVFADMEESAKSQDLANVKECVDLLKQTLPESWISMMKSDSEGSRLSKYHGTVGLEIRNNYLYGRSDSPLAQFFTSRGIRQVNSMSAIILTALFNDLHKKPTDIDKLIQAYKNAEEVSSARVDLERNVKPELQKTLLQTQDGKKISLAGLKGKVVVLVDVSVNAEGSKEAFAALNMLQAKFKPSDLQILGMVEPVRNEQELASDYKAKFLEKLKPTFPVVLNPPANFCSSLVSPGILTLPQVILINRQGKIVCLLNGWEDASKRVLYEKVAGLVGKTNDR